MAIQYNDNLITYASGETTFAGDDVGSSSSSSSSISSESSSSSSSSACPNHISEITAWTGTLDVTFENYLSCEISGSNNTYLALYSGDTTAKTPSDKAFYGELGTTTATSSDYVAIIINGETKYAQVYSGDVFSECTSIFDNGYSGASLSYIFYGYALINVNDNQSLFLPLYDITSSSSSSSSV